MGVAFPRVEAFSWLVVEVKTSTMNNLRREGISSEIDLIVLFMLEGEGVDQSFISAL